MDIYEPEDIPKDNPIDNPIFGKKTLKECDWGIACVSGQGNVYINKNLKTYNPALYNQILKHEMGHDLGPYNTNDLQEDMAVDFLTLTEKIKFCLKYPKGFAFLSPIIITKEEIMISWLGLFKLGVEISILLFILFWVI